jgi:hypothetical protein
MAQDEPHTQTWPAAGQCGKAKQRTAALLQLLLMQNDHHRDATITNGSLIDTTTLLLTPIWYVETAALLITAQIS